MILANKRLPLLAVIALAWLSLLALALQQPANGASAIHHARLGGFDFALMVLMWWGMAVAMMLPTAVPALGVLDELRGAALRKGEPAGDVRSFAAGFMMAWFAFGVLASLLQLTLHNGAILTPAGKSASRVFSALLFLLAGLYQWTPLKNACASKCRSPMSFFLSCWEAGNPGFLRMGLRLGKYCLGCCWAMMLLMFALGMMNLLWMGLLTLYMYIEKNWVRRGRFDRASGIVLVVIGGVMLTMPGLF